MAPMATMQAFMEKVKGDETLLAEFKRLAEKKDQAGIIAMMRDNGVSEEDIRKGQEMEKAFLPGHSDELSDELLEMVAGGRGECWSNVPVLIPGEKPNMCLMLHSGDTGTCGFIYQHD